MGIQNHVELNPWSQFLLSDLTLRHVCTLHWTYIVTLAPSSSFFHLAGTVECCSSHATRCGSISHSGNVVSAREEVGGVVHRTVQSPLYRKSICACINLFTTAGIRNAEHFRRLCGKARPEVMHWAHKNCYNSRCAVASDFDYFWYASSPTAAVRNNASAKFVAHSEGEIRADNWTWVKINILTKIGAISINQLLDSYCRYFMQEVTVL